MLLVQAEGRSIHTNVIIFFFGLSFLPSLGYCCFVALDTNGNRDEDRE